MLHDYYAILGISPTADLAVIRQAYRKKAAACHPDHGGSHAQMLLVNEAWSILSNPQSRARYDESRQQPNSEAAEAFSREDAPQARRHAAEYPRDWNQFEDWLDIVAADFSRARYGKVSGGVWGTVWPTSKDSLSAAVFLWGGGTGGFLVGLLIYSLCSPHCPSIIMSLRLLLMGSALFACGGAWIPGASQSVESATSLRLPTCKT